MRLGTVAALLVDGLAGMASLTGVVIAPSIQAGPAVDDRVRTTAAAGHDDRGLIDRRSGGDVGAALTVG